MPGIFGADDSGMRECCYPSGRLFFPEGDVPHSHAISTGLSSVALLTRDSEEPGFHDSALNLCRVIMHDFISNR